MRTKRFTSNRTQQLLTRQEAVVKMLSKALSQQDSKSLIKPEAHEKLNGLSCAVQLKL